MFREMNDGKMFPLLGFGTCKIENMDEAIDAAIQAGYRHFDTAKAYDNEEKFGAALEAAMKKHNVSRREIFLTSKIVPTSKDNAELVPAMVHETLRKLRTNYLDLVLVHYPKANKRENDDPENAGNRRDCFLALIEQRGLGFIRSVGVSNYEVRHLQEILSYSYEIPVVNQIEFHPHLRRADLLSYCRENNILIQAFSSLGRGNPALIDDPVVTNIAETNGKPVETILLAYALCQGIGVVPKSSNPERIAANYRAAMFKLSADELKCLDDIPMNQNYIRRCTPWLVL